MQEAIASAADASSSKHTIFRVLRECGITVAASKTVTVCGEYQIAIDYVLTDKASGEQVIMVLDDPERASFLSVICGMDAYAVNTVERGFRRIRCAI
jgi:hypothetical protein